MILVSCYRVHPSKQDLNGIPDSDSVPAIKLTAVSQLKLSSQITWSVLSNSTIPHGFPPSLHRFASCLICERFHFLTLFTGNVSLQYGKINRSALNFELSPLFK